MKFGRDRETRGALARPGAAVTLLGVVLLGAGLFWLTRLVSVTSWGFGFRYGAFDVPGGVVVLPLVIGVIWLFVRPKSIVPRIIIVLGLVFIVLSVLLSVRLVVMRQSLFEFIMMFLFIAAGCGLLLRGLFARH
ncbi:MAG: hypothetical protein LBC78_05315 [Oscillospiraceae bacterium]|jgi:hypothetical protein|nr:hypothetical protein [Oscillospiraceae bacterium]